MSSLESCTAQRQKQTLTFRRAASYVLVALRQEPCLALPAISPSAGPRIGTYRGESHKGREGSLWADLRVRVCMINLSPGVMLIEDHSRW